MSLFPAILICAIMLALLMMFISKGTSSIKFMLLGINITIIGGILILDSRIDQELGYLVVFFGLVLSIIGFWKKE